MTQSVSTLSILCMIVSGLIGFGLPVGLLLYFRLKKKADVLPFFIGCGVMLLFALVLESLVHQLVLLHSPVGDTIRNNRLYYALYGGFMAGLFEETGRFVAMKTVLKRYQGRDVNALMYGAGHGGFEALAILGITSINNVAWSVLINLGQAQLLTSAAGDAVAQVESTIQALVTTPFWQFLLGGVERISAVALQIGLSVLVWFAAKDTKKLYLYPLAWLLHMAVDAGTVLLADRLPMGWVEVAVATSALIVCLLARLVWVRNRKAEA